MRRNVFCPSRSERSEKVSSTEAHWQDKTGARRSGMRRKEQVCQNGTPEPGRSGGIEEMKLGFTLPLRPRSFADYGAYHGVDDVLAVAGRFQVVDKGFVDFKR